MHAWLVTPSFGLEQLRLAEAPLPVPGAGELLLRVRAASLNYRDLLVAEGKYNPRFRLPLVLGSDAVGDIVAFGPDTQRAGFSEGDRVCPLLAQGWLDGPPERAVMQATLGGPLPGVLAEFLVVRADSVVRVPSYLSDEEAATLPCAALTAWSALCEPAPLPRGATLLTLGGGGVSLFALALGIQLGARVFAVSRSAEKCRRLLTAGAEATLASNGPGWGRGVRQLAGGEGVDQVIEVGGAATLGESLQAVRPGGTVSFIGTAAGAEAAPDLMPIVMRNLRLQGVFVGHKRGFEAMLQALTAAELHPTIDSVFGFRDAAEALRRLKSGDHFGKVCVRVAE